MRKVKTKWTVNLTPDSKPLVDEGDVVGADQPLVEENVILEKVINLGIKMDIAGKEIEAGKVMYRTKGLFAKNILAPISGKVTRMDEFNNLYIHTGPTQKKIVNSPVVAKVVSIESDKMVLEFVAYEFTGEGLNDGREWAKNGLKQVKVLSDLQFTDADKLIIISNNYSNELIIKAEVMGIKGIIVVGEVKNKPMTKLPVLCVDEDTGELLKKEADKKMSVLLNAGNSRLLLVI